MTQAIRIHHTRKTEIWLNGLTGPDSTHGAVVVKLVDLEAFCARLRSHEATNDTLVVALPREDVGPRLTATLPYCETPSYGHDPD